ncbi:hypothetical protein FXF51_05920 [Nonomuraea sp. PA05]|uniref:hypothetical protein n=1 Tax=Nonomuraea sp. PA05 TaxID=2604466 RepID=UPI0011D43317|nr:hypothetical protein [Nonomuraea sp. PA05]TYB69697.1 hypothetical protein FXF51_05920 [Nonomuraea sp. PA05]
MSEEKHQGCRACDRTDVSLKADGTLRMHVRSKGGNAWLAPGGNRCHGAGEPPKGVLGHYAKQVIATLLPYFSDLKKPYVAEVIGEAVQKHHASPSETFEAILDGGSANWRLKPDGRNTGRVRLACYRLNERPEDLALEERVNAALAEIRYR